MAINSSILTWEIPRTEEPGGLQTLGLDTIQRLNSNNQIISFFKNEIPYAKLLQSCLTLCNPMDCSPPSRLLCPWESRFLSHLRSGHDYVFWEEFYFSFRFEVLKISSFCTKAFNKILSRSRSGHSHLPPNLGGKTELLELTIRVILAS